MAGENKADVHAVAAESYGLSKSPDHDIFSLIMATILIGMDIFGGSSSRTQLPLATAHTESLSSVVTEAQGFDL
jgi:hypothetical protein